MKKMNKTGAAWYTPGSQQGIIQPPYVVRWRGRWYRTLPLSQPVEAGPSMDAATRLAIESMPRLEMGVRRCLDYLIRTNKRVNELPLWTAAERMPHENHHD
jgi:hypothetical protein